MPFQNNSAREDTASAKDPAWLALPAVHYALMQGNQQPCFRLATGQPDTRHWVAWEVRKSCLSITIPTPGLVDVHMCNPGPVTRQVRVTRSK